MQIYCLFLSCVNVNDMIYVFDKMCATISGSESMAAGMLPGYIYLQLDIYYLFNA